jgi:hypothetical protein
MILNLIIKYKKMNWSKLEGDNYFKGEAPRKLTQKEIDYILESIQYIKVKYEYIDEINKENMRNFLLPQLESLEIVPEGIPELINVMQNRYNSSLLNAGESIGIIAAEAIGNVITQTALNTFHSSGRGKDKAISNISQLKDVISANSNVKFPVTTIHFMDKFMTYEQTMNKRIDIISKTPENFLLKTGDITLSSKEEFMKDWWYEFYTEQVEQIQSLIGMRLRFDIVQLYKYRTTLEDIASKFLEANIVICSPIEYGIIDIYLDDNYIIKKSEELKLSIDLDDEVKKRNLEIIYLAFAVRGFAGDKSHAIKGVSGVVDYAVNSDKIMNLVKEYKIDDKRKSVKYVFDKFKMSEYGLNIDKYAYLCKLLDIKILDYNEDYFITDISIDDKLKEDKYNTDEVKEALEYYFGVCYGITSEDINLGKYPSLTPISLLDLMSIIDLDLERIYSNDIHQICKYFGIEKAKESIVRIFYNIIGGSVNYIFFETIAELLTLSGIPRGANFTGITKNTSGHISKASFERAGKILTEHALSGDKESVKNLPVALIMGVDIANGTGKSKVFFGNEKVYIDGQISDNKNYNIELTEEVIEQEYGVKPQIKEYSNTEEELEQLRADIIDVGLKTGYKTRYPSVGQELIIPKTIEDNTTEMTINSKSINTMNSRKMTIRRTLLNSIEDDMDDEEY